MADFFLIRLYFFKTVKPKLFSEIAND